MSDRFQTILDFWFSREGSQEYGKARAVWFRKDPRFDERLRDQFIDDVEAALAGQHEDWSETPRGLLALIVLLDQFTRNLFRDSPKSFAGDAKALALSRKAIEVGWDKTLLPVQRWFLYLPFEHSEKLDDQEQALELFKALEAYPENQGAYDWAKKHYQVIARFGRFPHRNAILGRDSTAEERLFLQQPGSSF